MGIKITEKIRGRKKKLCYSGGVLPQQDHITMSAVPNIRDDTLMCEAIKSDEARAGGIVRIYSLCPCVTLIPS